MFVSLALEPTPDRVPELDEPPCLVGDLSGDEVVELCVFSNGLNACKTTAVLSPSKFASIGTRSGLREGFAVDLTTARANGTMWDLSLDDDKAELRRVRGKPIK